MKKILVVLLLVLFLVLHGCRPMSDVHPPKFHIGQVVTHELTGTRCQILSYVYYSGEGRGWLYCVRAPVTSANLTNHVLGSGGPVVLAPFTEETLYEMELVE